MSTVNTCLMLRVSERNNIQLRKSIEIHLSFTVNNTRNDVKALTGLHKFCSTQNNINCIKYDCKNNSYCKLHFSQTDSPAPKLTPLAEPDDQIVSLKQTELSLLMFVCTNCVNSTSCDTVTHSQLQHVIITTLFYLI